MSLAVVLHDIFGLPYDEIATLVGRSVAALCFLGPGAGTILMPVLSEGGVDLVARYTP